MDRKRKQAESEDKSDEGGGMAEGRKSHRSEPLRARLLSDPTNEHYLKWKKRTIEQARAELQLTT